MPEKKGPMNREKLFKELDRRDNLDNKLNIAWILANYNCAQGTAETYYYQWKKEYLKRKEKNIEPQETTKKENALKVKQMIVEGNNGTYRICECGVELTNQGFIISFENIEQLNSFVDEYRQAFSLMK